MGKYLDKFKSVGRNIKSKVDEATMETGSIVGDIPDDDIMEEDVTGQYPGSEVKIQPSQKPESFHHFILENQYKDLERSIRGYKDIYDKATQKWITKRKDSHCFTDEESEEILRTAQSHLATDIKLGYISKEAYPPMMMTIYEEIAFLFESIAEYRYGRYKATEKNGLTISAYEHQYIMKVQNHKIFLELFTRVQANYSRSIQGQENKLTHDSVQGQESLQQTDTDLNKAQRYT